ncbi:MAG: LacI family transcriptional regulator [Nitriliruptor sp.]|nr:MAG: LacI family transcriptional regulator [Nitriliruptor sp.]
MHLGGGAPGQGPHGMATISEVARHAGVGVGTVSRVLNGHPAVTDETRARVTRSMEELDYRPSPLARGLKRGRSNRIAVLVSFITQPSSVERLRGLTQALSGSGYELVLYPVEDDEQRRAHMDTLTGPHQADGIVLISLPLSDEEAVRLQKVAVSLVQVDASHAAFSSVLTDDVHGGELAARHLLELGHRELAFVGDAEDNPYGFTSSSDRRAGFLRVLSDAGCTPPDQWVRTGSIGAESATSLAREVLAAPRRPTGVFAASDVQAFGVMLAARELGLRVPEDVSVVGFDDIETAKHVGLSTVRQPLQGSGRLAAELLLDALTEPNTSEPERHLLPLEVVSRLTTRALPR